MWYKEIEELKQAYFLLLLSEIIPLIRIRMRKYLRYSFLGLLLALMASGQVFAQTAIYLGGTYEGGADARADRQIYNTSSSEFDNEFSVSYDVVAVPGYLFGIGGNNFAIEYRVTESQITPGPGADAVRFAHNNIMLIGRSSTGVRRAKVGIGTGNALSPAQGNIILSTDKNYKTNTYLLGYDFVPGGGDLTETKHGFFIEYQNVVARSGSFREVDAGATTDLSVRETIRYTQFVLGYVYRFGTTP